MSKILAAALLGAFTFAFVAAPVSFDPSSSTVTKASAFARGGDDGGSEAGHGGHGGDDGR